MLKAILFDLDGTLLQMDQDVFVREYFTSLAEKFSHYGYDKQKLTQAVWAGVHAMIKNDGSVTNEEAYNAVFYKYFGDKGKEDLPLFGEYYRVDFDKVSHVSVFTPRSKGTVDKLKAKGYRVVLATNPVFPAIATHTRMRWADLAPSDFEFITTYENSRYCKPSAAYYRDIAEKLGVEPCECLMVGNDVSDDMPAATLGMKVFLLDDHLINKNNEDISSYPHGSFEELLAFIDDLEK